MNKLRLILALAILSCTSQAAAVAIAAPEINDALHARVIRWTADTEARKNDCRAEYRGSPLLPWIIERHVTSYAAAWQRVGEKFARALSPAFDLIGKDHTTRGNGIDSILTTADGDTHLPLDDSVAIGAYLRKVFLPEDVKPEEAPRLAAFLARVGA